MDKAEIKKSIQEYINRGLIEDSIILIEEYKKSFDSDEDIYSIEAIINNYSKEKLKERKIKFLLRRIEFDLVEKEDKIEILESEDITDNIILDSVNKNIINKAKVLNYIAIYFFNNSYYERVLPYLEEAYRVNNNDKDTLYNLSYVLNCIGEKDLALCYAEKITEKNAEVFELIDIIRGENR